MLEMVNLDDLRRVSTRQAVNVAGFILIFGCLFAMASIVVIGVMGKFDALWIAALVFAGFGFAAFAAGLAIFGLNIWHSREIVQRGITLLDREIARRLPAPEPTPTPAPAHTLPANEKGADGDTQAESRGGERERQIQGFDAATIAWVCDYLANGNRWTEAAMEKMPVPHMFPPARFGKAEGGSPYQRLFDSEHGIFVRAGIIVERGGEGNSPGKLAIKSPLNMLERIKALQEDSPNA